MSWKGVIDPYLHDGLVASGDLLQVVHVVIVVTRGAQQLKGQVTNDGRCSVVHKEELPLEAVLGGELGIRLVNHRELP